ncbi:iron(3+)-hydroxamate-binding protein fhuD [Paenibacillus sp. 598K]|nr:iron(3+)-hydroxamate-binding protein fhuD [Paenibacillus sp. 598K]
MWLVMALAVLLVASACGQSDKTSESSGANKGAGTANTAPSTEEAETPAANADAEPAMVAYQSAAGEVMVPANPERIVDLTAFTTGYFVALDAPVVGALTGAMNNKYIKDQLAAQGTADLGQLPTVEQLVELKPDLILVYAGTDGIDQLEKVAPVVQINYGELHFKDLMRELGKLTNREEAATTWIEQWETRIDELKPQVQQAVGDRTVSILNPYAGGVYVFGHNYGRGGEIIYGEFELKAPPKPQAEAIDSGTGFASISLEVLPEYAGDIIFTSRWSGDDSDPALVYDNPLWSSLPAVKNNHVFQLDPESDTYNDPMSLDGQLTFIADSLLAD